MSVSDRPILIKKVKKVSGGGHHGGAWKVAYADFVTAMMAFFLLMWLINTTDPEQKKGIAEYFAPASVSETTSGSGGILGQGMGEGFSKFLYLPEQYTDFAYAVFSQEYGFIGSATLLCLYLAFMLYGLSVGRKLKETYPALLVYGLTLLISVQGLVNIAMVIGWFPVTGIPLPFISFGGTSLLMNMAALGLIWGTATQSLREYDEQERRKRIAAMEGRPLSFGELSGSVYGSRS